MPTNVTSIFDFAHTGSVDFLAVEETFISDESSFKALTSNCSGPVFCSRECVSLFISK